METYRWYSEVLDTRGRPCVVVPKQQFWQLIKILEELPQRVNCRTCNKDIKYTDSTYMEPNGLIPSGHYCPDCHKTRWDNV